MISRILQSTLKEQGKLHWLSTGKDLSPHYKNVLKAYGFSPRYYTAILYQDKDITLSQLRSLCEMLGIEIKVII